MQSPDGASKVKTITLNMASSQESKTESGCWEDLSFWVKTDGIEKQRGNVPHCGCIFQPCIGPPILCTIRDRTCVCMMSWASIGFGTAFSITWLSQQHNISTLDPLGCPFSFYFFTRSPILEKFPCLKLNGTVLDFLVTFPSIRIAASTL